MNLLFIILNETDYLHDILGIFTELGVKGATIIDSQGMGSAIVHGEASDIPLFGSLKNLLKEAGPYSKTIFTVIHNEFLLERTIQAIRDLLASDSSTTKGFMFTVPVNNIYLLK